MPRYTAQDLQSFAERLIVGMGADDDIAYEVARHLVRANLAGHDSHGIIRLSQYGDRVKSGAINPNARPTILRDSPAAVLLDANRGFGQWSTMEATKIAIDRAKTYGTATVSIRHSMHIGRLGEYSEAMAAAGQASIVTVGMAGPGVGGVSIPGTSGRFFAANPWTFGIPAANGDVLVDASTSAVAEGKVRVALDGNKPLPEGALVTKDGAPTTSAEDFYAGGAILPLGGDVAVHKGYGFALASAAFGAIGMIGDEDPTMAGASSVSEGSSRGRMAGVTIVAIDLGAFGGEAGYRELIGDVTDAIRATPSRSGDTPIVPGEPERTTERARLADGIDLPEATVAGLGAQAETFGVAPLAAAS